MPSSVLILHTKPFDTMANHLSTSLIMAGFYTITLGKVVGDSTRAEIQASWPVIASDIPAFIILGTPDLMFDRYLSEMSLDLLAAKKAICVVYGFCDRLPRWFLPHAITIEWGDYVNWNRLVCALNKFVPISPQPPQPRPFKQRLL